MTIKHRHSFQYQSQIIHKVITLNALRDMEQGILVWGHDSFGLQADC